MSSVHLQLFCDEVKESVLRNPYGENETWVYLGILIVPTYMKSELIENLLDRRCGNPAPKKWGQCLPLCEFHEKNDKEVHYQELGRADVFHITSRWLDFFLADRSLTYFYILGINFSRLNFDFFGEVKGAERYYRIYNRFFRMALQKSVKSYFSSCNNIVIDKIFHDKGDIAEYEIFP